MIQASTSNDVVIEAYFNLLFLSLEESDYTGASILLSKLSPYSNSFSTEQLEMYNEAEILCNHAGSPRLHFIEEEEEDIFEDDGQPSWEQEWHDFDPDC